MSTADTSKKTDKISLGEETAKSPVSGLHYRNEGKKPKPQGYTGIRPYWNRKATFITKGTQEGNDFKNLSQEEQEEKLEKDGYKEIRPGLWRKVVD